MFNFSDCNKVIQYFWKLIAFSALRPLQECQLLKRSYNCTNGMQIKTPSVDISQKWRVQVQRKLSVITSAPPSRYFITLYFYTLMSLICISDLHSVLQTRLKSKNIFWALICSILMLLFGQKIDTLLGIEPGSILWKSTAQPVNAHLLWKGQHPSKADLLFDWIGFNQLTGLDSINWPDWIQSIDRIGFNQLTGLVSLKQVNLLLT